MDDSDTLRLARHQSTRPQTVFSRPALFARVPLKTMALARRNVVACVCGIVLIVAAAPALAAPGPGQFANSYLKVFHNPEQYTMTLDANVRRTTEPAALFQNSIPLAPTFGGAGFIVPADPYKGKRVRVTAYLKTQDVARWTGLLVEVNGVGGRIHASDSMSDRPIHGTTDWTQYCSVVDVPADTLNLTVGVLLYGSGKVWVDGVEITPVGTDVPCTDDQNWHTWSPNAHLYSAAPDPDTRRNGHPTTRVSSVDTGYSDFGIYDHGQRHIEQYLGRRVRLTAWLKGERVTGGSGLSIRVNGASLRQIANEGQKGRRPLVGTRDWQKYEAVADVPAEAQSIFLGITLNGRGTIWIDDVQTEVIDVTK